MSKSFGVRGSYQKCKPITTKNIGKQMPHEKKGKKDYRKVVPDSPEGKGGG